MITNHPSLTRRGLLGGLLAGPIAAVALRSAPARAQGEATPLELPPLPYAPDALEPHIDAQTMTLHHDKHHATYVKNLTDSLAKHPDLKSKSLEDMLRNLDAVPEDIRTAVRNNGGGHYNHSMFWRIMKPQGGGSPAGPVAAAINSSFGSAERLREVFNQTAGRHFGSGWVWLAHSGGKMEIRTTINQDNPLMRGAFPILGNDLWEHAYYLKYQNRRPEYLQAWWNVVNWDEVNRRFEMAKR